MDFSPLHFPISKVSICITCHVWVYLQDFFFLGSSKHNGVSWVLWHVVDLRLPVLVYQVLAA